MIPHAVARWPTRESDVTKPRRLGANSQGVPAKRHRRRDKTPSHEIRVHSERRFALAEKKSASSSTRRRPGDCPILRPRAGLPLSRACDSPFAMSFGATHAPRDSPHPCGPLLAAACLRRDTSSALRACSRSWSHGRHAAECTHAASASLRHSCSQDDGDAHQLCSGEDERPQRRHHVGGVVPGRDQDRVRMHWRDDHSLGFGCAASTQIAPPWPKLTSAGFCLAAKLELLSEKTNAHSDVIGSVAFSPDGTKIVSGSVDKTIKVWDSGAPRALKSPSLAKPDACWLLSGRQTGAAEREDGRAQQLRPVGGVFPRRDQDCVRIGRRDDQSMEFGCAASTQIALLGQT